MCQSCWIGDHGMPAVADDDTMATALLIERLYAMPGCANGGPLHWMLDDMNLDDDQFGEGDPVGYWHGLFDYLEDGRFDRGAKASPVEKREIVVTCEAILYALGAMTDGQRAAAVAWAFGWIGAELPEHAARVRTPEAVERIEAYAEELLDRARELPSPEERARLAAERAARPQACVPVECPPFRDVTLDVEPIGDLRQPGGVPMVHAVRAVGVDPARADGASSVVVRGVVDGVMHPGPGMRFAPDAKITGPFEDIRILPDGSAMVSGLRIGTSGLLDVGPPMFGPVVPGEDAKPTFKWAEYTITNGDGTTEVVRWDAETLAQAATPPQVDLAEVLREQPPQVTYNHEEPKG